MYARLNKGASSTTGRASISTMQICDYLDRVTSSPLVLFDKEEIVDLIEEMDDLHMKHIAKEQEATKKKNG